MSIIAEALCKHAGTTPQAVALKDEHYKICYPELYALTQSLAASFAKNNQVIALLSDNGPAWAIVDLAALEANIPFVPIPAFFSDDQIRHIILDAGVDCVITDNKGRIQDIFHSTSTRSENILPAVLQNSGYTTLSISTLKRSRVPQNICKITYTSGTTGEPKGVCLSKSAVEQTATALLNRIGHCAVERHVSLLPLATLLENIGGLYLPLLSGGCCHLPDLNSAGIYGAAGLDGKKMTDTLSKFDATSTILIPQMLRTLVQQPERISTLRFVAVGGAPIADGEIKDARALGLPAYQGYGLSECTSVVSLNTPGNGKTNSVGKPLDHVQLRITEDNEIQVKGAIFSGYLGDKPKPSSGFLPTGDLGYLDDQGYLYLTGRKKNMYITSYGRNISPDWIESEFLREAAIDQVCVFGEAMPFNVAVLVSNHEKPEMVKRAIQNANKRLPDYARVAYWIVADAPFTSSNKQCTGNGRPRRQRIFQHYQTAINQFYSDSINAKENIA